MAQDFQEIPGLRVEVGDVVYMPHLDAPVEKPHPFVYFLAIVNGSKSAVTIQGRKWIVKESSGEVTVVEGQGVVGETPVIQAGERFTYHSYHVVKNEAEASGAFFGVDSSGKGIRVKIPAFQLKVPDGL